jgi:gamma-glutamyltranspeptidase
MPVLALENGAPVLAFGTPGGFAQTQVNVQVLNNIVLFEMTPQQAIDAPRFVRMRNGLLQLETAVGEETASALANAGYDTRLRPPSDLFGGAQAIRIDPATGATRAGADRRREGFALAW